MKKGSFLSFSGSVLIVLLTLFFAACGGGYGGNGGGGGGGGGSAPGAPTGLTATTGTQQVVLAWTASSGATSYHVKRATVSGGPYTQVAAPATNAYTDSAVTSGTAYYYVVSALNTYGESADSSQASATPTAAANPPATPTGLNATAGNQQVSLSWSASTGATTYQVGRATTSGGPYTTQACSTASTSCTDSSVTNGTTYYYVIAAANAGGTSANSSQVSATPTAPTTAVSVSIDVMTNRHSISPYVYGGNGSKDAAHITDSGTTLVRWGGNASSTYNWQLHTYNADNDYFFEDFGFGMLNNSADSDSAQFIKDVKTAGSVPLMTMVMLPWVAQSPESAGASGNLHWTFSVSHDGACASKVDQFNTDAGINLKSDCVTPMVASQAQLNRAYFPLMDGPPQSGDPANAVYRSQWVTDASKGLAQAFGSGPTCPIPYSTLTSCHFYDMDNETDIWGGTHVDVHPNPAGYDELRDTYLLQARNLKGWDPSAVTLGPVSCCWWFYWNGANGNDKGAHAGGDFLPWWLNEVYWRDQIAGSRSLDLFDIHAYPDGPDLAGMTTAQKRAAAVSIYRDYWDPTLVSPSGTVNQPFTTNIQPDKTIAFRIPRMRAIVNSIYPGTPLATTEWSAGFVSESDFSTALGDADAYGIMGRERVSLSTRWGAPDPANPNYQALKLYTNYDGALHTFNPVSVSATHDASPDLFSVYAATNSAGNSMTLMVLNKDPSNATQSSFSFNGFTPSQVTAYTLSQSSPNSISAGASHAWSSSMTFQPYTATLLVITGSSTPPASEWDLNPDVTMAPASGTVTLAPKLTSGSATVTLNTAVFDSYEGASPCNSASIGLTNPTVAAGLPGVITLNAAASAGFCHFSVTGSDGTTQGGWLVVGNPAATLAKTAGDSQSATHGTVLPTALTVTLSPGSSGGTAGGASVFFSITSATGGSLTNVQVGSEQVFTGTKVIGVTNSSGVAKVTLTLPASTGAVTVTAEGPYGLGHPVVTFNETAN